MRALRGYRNKIRNNIKWFEYMGRGVGLSLRMDFNFNNE